MNLGETIRDIRKSKGFKRRELADRVGISPNAMCSIEKNYSFPSKETIKAICDAMDVPVSYLLFASITDDDIPQDKLPIFKALQKPILDLFEK